jgi:hypothetical protein
MDRKTQVQSSESTQQTSVNMSRNMLDVTGFLKEINLSYLPKLSRQRSYLICLKGLNTQLNILIN